MYKISKENVRLLDAVDVYRLVLDRKIKRFPLGFWKRPEAEQNAIKYVTYLIEELLKWDDKKILKCLSNKVFAEYGLLSIITNLYKGSVYSIVEDTYPGRFKPWELSQISKGYWNETTAKEALLWVVKEKLDFKREEIENINKSKLAAYGLKISFLQVFDNDIEAIKKYLLSLLD